MDSQSPAVILKTLKMIHMAMFSSIVIFSGISLYLRNELGMTLEPPTIEMLYYISLISILAFIPLGYWLHGKKMKSMGNDSTLSSKLSVYQSSHITKIALFETSALLSLVVLIVGGKNSILIQVAIVLIIILLNMPSAHKLSTELNLSPEESNLLLF
jgi:hypothetical protein